jgi:general secretion pathway protein J
LSKGFTLIEVLVAISIMAVMALMAWRGIDGMLRIQTGGPAATRTGQASGGLMGKINDQSTLQMGLAQWQTDLNRLAWLTGTPSWDWDGKVLRLTREANTAAEGVRVVAWSWRAQGLQPGAGYWLRWQSAPVRSREAWQAAWQNARVWSQSPTAELRQAEVSILPLAGWQIYVHLGGSWSSAQSSDERNSAEAASSDRIPDGVRLILKPAGQPSSEASHITLDWMRPNLSGRNL